MAELAECKAALKTIRAKADEYLGDVTPLNTNIAHHKKMLEAYARGLGEALQKVRSGKASPKEAEAIMASAKSSITALETCETEMAKLEKLALASKKQLDELESRIETYLSKNKKDPEIAELTKLKRTISQLSGSLTTEVIAGTESGFKAAKPIKLYEADLADYLKMSAAAAEVQAQAAALRDKLPMLFNNRHIVVRKAELDKAIATATKALDDAGDALSASKAGLMSRPPIIAVATIDDDIAAAQKALVTIKEIFSEYGTGMADLARNKAEQKEFLTTKEGKLATAILKAGHDAQTDIAPRIKTLRKTESDLHTVATKMEAAQKAQKEARKKEEASKAAQLAAAKAAGEI